MVSKSPDKKQAQIIDAATGTLEDTPGDFGTCGKDGRRIDLSNLRDVRLEMARVYRQSDAGVIKTQDATRRVFILRQIGDILHHAELEQRVIDLEERMARQIAQRGHAGLPARLN
jgi:hypothetical protein